MCFIKESIIPKIAIKDILVHKALLIRNEKIVTPCTRMIIPDNGIIKAKESLLNFLTKSNLNGEGVHSYSIVVNKDYLFGTLYVKAYIPKGTLYFENSRGEICSRQLKVTNELVNKIFYLIDSHLVSDFENYLMKYSFAQKVIINTTTELLTFSK